jgi:protein-disulfide isomerase
VNGTEPAAPPAKTGLFGAALAGGIVGSALTAALLFVAAPSLLGSKIVRDGILADPGILLEASDALHQAQFAPVLNANRAAIETPFGSSWKGAAKPEVTMVEFFDYACPYCKASNPAVDRLLQEDKGLRVVYRELPILGPDSVTAARLSLEASKAGRFAQFHDSLWAAGRPSPETNAQAASAAGIPAQPVSDPNIEAELNSNMKLAGQLGATGTPLFVVGDRVMNGAVGYDTLKDAIAKARTKA